MWLKIIVMLYLTIFEKGVRKILLPGTFFKWLWKHAYTSISYFVTSFFFTLPHFMFIFWMLSHQKCNWCVDVSCSCFSLLLQQVSKDRNVNKNSFFLTQKRLKKIEKKIFISWIIRCYLHVEIRRAHTQ